MADHHILPDNPCWGSPNACSLDDLLALVSRSELILSESPDYLVLNKPPDLRMDGPYGASVYKLLTYWYPPPSLQQLTQDALLQHVTKHVHQSKDVPDFELRPCHQLDYATSGVLLVARNHASASRAVDAFERRAVTKVYLALVHGHVFANQVLQNYQTIEGRQKQYRQRHTDDRSNVYISREYLDEFMTTTERAYQRSRKKPSHKAKTFQGFLPAPALFQKWKSFQQQQQQQNKKQLPTKTQHDVLHETCSSKRRRTISTSISSSTDWNEFWKKLTSDLLTDYEQSQLLSLEWKQVKKNAIWADIFSKASDVYNERLRSATVGATVTDDPVAVEVQSNNTESLPTVFRIQDDDKPNLFYIYASTAEVPNQFAVQVKEEARLFLSGVSNKEAITSSKDMLSNSMGLAAPGTEVINTMIVAPTLNDTKLDYKPALTQCTILDHAYLDMNGTLVPVTKVRLEPKTGRRHQLRVHMAHVLGSPIVQDMTYATTTESVNQTPNIKSAEAIETNGNVTSEGGVAIADCGNSNRCDRMCLHAHSLKISLLEKTSGDVVKSKAPSEINATAPDPFVMEAQPAQSVPKIVHRRRG